MKPIKTLLSYMLLWPWLIFAANLSAAEVKPPMKIYAVNYPLQFFAQTIAGDTADVRLPMPADVDPAYWSPTTDDIVQLQQADLVLLNGANYAKWLPKVSLPIFKLVNTSSEFRDAYIPLATTITHQHGSGGEHSHTGTAFTTWLDFSQAQMQAKAIYRALTKKNPALQPRLVQNFVPLQQNLEELDDAMAAIGSALANQPLLGSHPVYQYLKRAYQLNLKSVHWEPTEIPSEQQWQELEQMLTEHPAHWMLWENVPAQTIVSRLKTMNVNSIVFSPAANAPESGDFMSIMRDNVHGLKTITEPAR